MKAIYDILNAVKNVTGVKIDDLNKNLLHQDFGIDISDFLYILDILSQCGYPIYEAIEKRNYTIFTANNIAKAIS